ncbi:6609_t:CDS:2 [Diversispora eburnea]|uniref:6609_t:CDS:1 n=1 Tax=Diversispora eburnea TaxID=1213867 RepID=A0A9N9CCZ6_9GLOM|nr:6609_t:CDS:2 [Diversispora eburnea]
MQTTTSFYRLSGSGLKNNQRDDEGNDERGGTNLRNPKHCPSGVYVMPSDNFYTWYGVLFVHKGYYKNERPPGVQFILDLINNEVPFHPLIDPETGNFSLTQQFKDWAPHKYYIFHILHYLKKSFKKGVLDNLSKKHCPNEKAFTTYKENPKQFENMAKQCSKLSTSETLTERERPNHTSRRTYSVSSINSFVPSQQ